MKYPKNSFSFAYAASLIEFPGEVVDFIFWLRHHKFLSGDLKPHPACLAMNLFVNHEQEIPGRVREQVEVIVVPRLTMKGLTYLMNTFDPKNFKSLDLTAVNDLTN